MDDHKIYVSENEYSRLCRVDGRMDAIIEYIKEKKKEGRLVDESTIKSIIGMDNFK